MISKAVLKYIRISPRKFRLIIPLVKGKRCEEAISILMAVKKGASKYAIELLKSAIANAKRKQQGIDVSNLYVSKLIADCGPTLKRFRAASMGRASEILKRTSHLTLELDEIKHSPQHQAHAHKAKEEHTVKHGAAKPEKAATAKKAKSKEPAKEAAGKKHKE